MWLQNPSENEFKLILRFANLGFVCVKMGKNRKNEPDFTVSIKCTY